MTCSIKYSDMQDLSSINTTMNNDAINLFEQKSDFFSSSFTLLTIVILQPTVNSDNQLHSFVISSNLSNKTIAFFFHHSLYFS
jgi:hypothetical protein